MPKPLLECSKRRSVMVNELVEVIYGGIRRQDRPVPASNRGIRTRRFHHGHCGGAHDVSCGRPSRRRAETTDKPERSRTRPYKHRGSAIAEGPWSASDGQPCSYIACFSYQYCTRLTLIALATLATRLEETHERRHFSNYARVDVISRTRVRILK